MSTPMRSLSPRRARRILLLALGLALAGPVVAGETCDLAGPGEDAGGATATGTAATACGVDAEAGGHSSTAVGTNAAANGERGTAVGASSVAAGQASTAVGNGSVADGQDGTALGDGANALAMATTALGAKATASAFADVALGTAASATGAPGDRDPKPARLRGALPRPPGPLHRTLDQRVFARGISGHLCQPLGSDPQQADPVPGGRGADHCRAAPATRPAPATQCPAPGDTRS